MTTLILQCDENDGSTSYDIAHEAVDGTGFDAGTGNGRMESAAADADRFNSGFRFLGTTGLEGATISSAEMQFYTLDDGQKEPTYYNDINAYFYCEDHDDSPDFNTNADVTSRSKTTGTLTLWQQADMGGTDSGWKYMTGVASGKLGDHFQEVIDRIAEHLPELLLIDEARGDQSNHQAHPRLMPHQERARKAHQ